VRFDHTEVIFVVLEATHQGLPEQFFRPPGDAEPFVAVIVDSPAMQPLPSQLGDCLSLE
jgi:hypothetical protein